jgi:lipoate-protein ligase A
MGSPFNVERYRTLPHRHAEAQALAQPTLVLGSTQRPELVADPVARARGVEVVRRRGGGGAVLLRPGDHLWVDAWVPRDDPLWSNDVSVAATRVGDWWRAGLERAGVGDTTVFEGRAIPGELGALVCFAGRGPGEVFSGERKVVGLSQWRARQGALFSACVYTHWEPAPLVELLDLEAGVRTSTVRDLIPVAAGLRDGVGGGGDGTGGLDVLREALLSSFGAWGSAPSV